MPTYTVRELIEMRVGPALAAADLDQCNDVNGSYTPTRPAAETPSASAREAQLGPHQQH
jgi:hypothetical protein